MDIIFKVAGSIGLILICLGIIKKTRKTQDIYYIIGGIFLEIYSIFLGDIVFIVLQLVFSLSALYDYIKCGNKKRK